MTSTEKRSRLSWSRAGFAMAHVDCSKLAKGLRLEGKVLQALHPFRNTLILKAAGMGSAVFFKAIPVRLLGGDEL